MISTQALLVELGDVLRREKFAERLSSADVSLNDLIMGYAALAKVIKPTSPVSVVIDDPDDNSILECAIVAHADAIVSRDSHLLKLKVFQDIPILTANELLNKILK